MRENNRKPIEKCRKKLPQFTTMNVIDGQAGLVIYSSLIFYSLTIDNILNIIVLLILAGVTIAALSGDNGILQRASEARQDTLDAQNAENATLEGYEDAIDYVLSSEAGTVITDIPEDWTSTHVTAISDGEGGVIPLPEGFCYVGGKKSEGIIISDNSLDAGKGTSHEVAQTLQGNQFVWIPVEIDKDFKRYDGYRNGMLQSDYSAEVDGILNYFENFSEPYTINASEQEEYNRMETNVLLYNGFYVGRYEAGTTADSGTDIRGTIVIKQGAKVYNNIGWSDSDDMSDETGGAVEVSKGMYFDSNSVTSTLIYGVQWDAIMQWIDTNYKNQDGTLTSFVADSSGHGNYSGKILPTGSNVNYAVKNIYDLAGNVYEWTMESYNNDNRTSRGRKLWLCGFCSSSKQSYC